MVPKSRKLPLDAVALIVVVLAGDGQQTFPLLVPDVQLLPLAVPVRKARGAVAKVEDLCAVGDGAVGPRAVIGFREGQVRQWRHQLDPDRPMVNDRDINLLAQADPEGGDTKHLVRNACLTLVDKPLNAIQICLGGRAKVLDPNPDRMLLACSARQGKNHKPASRHNTYLPSLQTRGE